MAKRERTRRADALTLLREDHLKVQRLLEQYERAPRDERGALAQQICSELTIHAQIEEELFYPQLNDPAGDEQLLAEAAIEHDVLKRLVERIKSENLDAATADGLIRVLGEYVQHHVNEEQRKIFPLARRSGLDLEALAVEIEQRKARMTGLPADATLIRPGNLDDSGVQVRMPGT